MSRPQVPLVAPSDNFRSQSLDVPIDLTVPTVEEDVAAEENVAVEETRHSPILAKRLVVNLPEPIPTSHIAQQSPAEDHIGDAMYHQHSRNTSPATKRKLEGE